jgi:hypothetical protein
MQKIHLFLLATLITSFLVSSVLASPPSIFVVSTDYIPSPFEDIFGSYSTGSQIVSKVIVTDAVNSMNIKRTFIVWDSSITGCVRDYTHQDNFSANYTCTLTVTPTMNTQTSVYIHAENNDGISSALLGVYDFYGKPFPEYTPNPHVPVTDKCVMQQTCSKYKSICHYDIICRKYSGDICVSSYKKKVCELTDECMRWRNKRICTR